MMGEKERPGPEMAIKILFAEDLEIPLIQPAQMLGQKSLSLRAEGFKDLISVFKGSRWSVFRNSSGHLSNKVLR
jgi:hypothetical protein